MTLTSLTPAQRARVEQLCRTLLAEQAHRRTHPPLPWAAHPHRRLFDLPFRSPPAHPTEETPR